MQFLHEGLDYYLNPAVAKELQKRYLIKSLKVSLFQKQIFLFSFEPKSEQNYFLISALASKNGPNQKIEGT